MKKNTCFHSFIYTLLQGSFVLLMFSACESPNSADSNIPLFETVNADASGLHFVNRLRESPSQNVLTYEYFYNGAGVAAADFNGDELPDIYFVSNLEANALYLNQGNLAFKDVSKISQSEGSRGFATGVSVVDINADGLLDIYICKSGRFTNPDLRRNELFINQGNNADGVPIFSEQADEYGLDIPAYSTQASFFDYDNDGDLDVFLINHGIDTYETNQVPMLQQEIDPLIGEMLLRNDDQHFVDVSEEAGIIRNRLGFGLGLGVGDFNADHYPDVYVSNDYSGKDHLYINQQDGTFQESIEELTNQISFYAMGNDIGDINNDGWSDIINLDMVAADNYGIKTSMSAMNPAQFYALTEQGEHYQYMFNSLLLSNGSINKQDAPLFSNIGQLAGISNTDWSWGPLLFDMDNDGWQDIFITNGIKRNIRNNDATKRVVELQQLLANANTEQDRSRLMQQMLQQFPSHRKANYFFQNNRDLGFDDITIALGFDTLLTASNGAAYADFDLDGDLDLVVNNVDQMASLFQNNASAINNNASLNITLNGPAQNPLGIGAKVSIQNGSTIQTKEVYTSRGYQSSVAPTIHFGWPTGEVIKQLEIVWPDGKSQQLHNVQAGKLQLQYNDAAFTESSDEITKPVFSTTDTRSWQHKHEENVFDDFERESLLPHRMSNMGPAAAVGDVDGNGLTDVFIGGAAGQPAVLYLQHTEQNFAPTQLQLWASEQSYEDVTAVLFDVDHDQDLDLLVGGGSNEWPGNDPHYQLRLFENDGQGIFHKNTTALPPLRVSTGVLAIGDMDADGKADIFVGARQMPGRYPQAASSYLLKNESSASNITFTDQTENWAPFLADFGMITDAVWTDVNGDERLDLMTVGEWMSPRLLLNTGRKLEDASATAQLDTEHGWWYSLAAADIDADGDVDFVAGNLGLNYKYKAQPEAPFTVFSKDFDQNGSQDIVLGYHSDGDLFPLRGRECSSGQMPFIKEKFPTYDAYAKATIEEVYGASDLQSATHYSASNFAHCYFENDGEGVFTVKALPNAAQISSVNAILIDDFDNDAKLDILCAGNLYGAEVETPRNDASYGHLLKGTGNGHFELVPAPTTGLRIKGEVRNLLPISLTDNQLNHILVIKNNSSIQVLQRH